MICGVRCPACAVPVPDAASSCPGCGARLSPAAMATVTSPGGVAGAPLTTPHSSARTAGTILAGRYRIVGLLGRGGMGEVYRADDLTLGQPVALKFLPASAAADPAALARFHNEVRVARQVSHPNVCRIHDLGDADGEPFLTMEYVDGEDLSSLLRRIGRLPADKAIESARQLCAGLAAAHDMSVLHRDLKPANVMLDGRGVVKITDFGLASFSEQIARDDISGTPAYMAPEQLAGRPATVASDVYAVGLVLFEMFTGVPAFAPGSAADRARSSADSAPPTPSSARPDIDPAVEQVIVRCLDPDPARRPPSARVIGAALPGRDPLAAALAAGETPSPQMVADAATQGRLRPASAWALLVSLAIGIAAVGAINGRAAPYRAGLLELSPEVLRVRAAQIVERAGRSRAARDWAAGFEFDPDVAAFLRRDGSAGHWRRAESGRPGLIRFWYRESEWWVIPWSMTHLPTSLDPPPTEAGALVLLDRGGNLQRLTTIVAPGADLPPSAVPPDWSGLFEAAGLRLADFEPVEPSRVAPVSADVRVAWIEKGAEDLATRVRVEAAAMAARPVHFEVVSPFPRIRSFTTVPVGRLVMLAIVVLTLILAAALLARRNTRMGRSDMRGALRLALFSFSLFVPIYLFGIHHVPAVQEVTQLFKVAMTQLAWAGIFWLAYVAIEPLVRRRWPDLIVSSTRLLAGRVTDPLIGRDVLIGAVGGTIGAALGATHLLASTVFELPRHTLPAPFVLGPLYSAAQAVGQFVWIVQIALQNALGVMLLLVVLTGVLRRRWLATAAFFMICVALMGVPSGSAPLVLVQALLATLVVTRFGILAAVTYTLFFLSSIWFPLTLDPSAFYITSSVIVSALLLGLGWCALYTTLGGKPLGGWTESPSV
jgi:protein kinase-like protein